MRFTLSWLKKFLDTDLSIDVIAISLTNIGLEVEEIIDQSSVYNKFIVAKIVEATQHPNADKLKICKVQISEDPEDILQIVCGAGNARDNIKVVLAMEGAIVPNGGFAIKKSKIRGVESCGMLCSADELKIENNLSDGIIELKNDAIIGATFASYIGVNDVIIQINVTPNRGDALGVYGIARDLAAAGVGILKDTGHKSIDASYVSDIAVKVEDVFACPLFIVRECKNINNNIESPKWLRSCLENIGLKSISPIVDITNYICHSFAQPMHAYDADKIHNNILQVKSLLATKKIIALNDSIYDLEPGDLVISDHNDEVQALAGIIGSKQSSCEANTTRILLEAAYFSPEKIATSGRRAMIDTDSRHRFERHIDPLFVTYAIDIAASMLQEICGAEIGEKIIVDNSKNNQIIIDFPVESFAQKVGFALDSKKIIDILTKLGFSSVQQSENIIKISPPSWRSDISIAEDIIEEILRIYGYDKIPQQPLNYTNIDSILPDYINHFSKIRRILAVNGYDEVVSWSFMDIAKAKFFTETKPDLELINPISSELNYMRPSIIPNLLVMSLRNINRSYKDLSLFELGPIFFSSSDEKATSSVAGVRVGHVSDKNIHDSRRLFDIFDIKSDVENIFEYFEIKPTIAKITAQYFHPTRSADLMIGRNIVGHFGEIHPAILLEFDINVKIMAFEIFLDKIDQSFKSKRKLAEYNPSDYQTISRDYAFLVDHDLQVGNMIDIINNIEPKLIKAVQLFDIYVGEKIPCGKKSVAFSVTIQNHHKTLTDDEINEINHKIITVCDEKCAAKIREL